MLSLSSIWVKSWVGGFQLPNALTIENYNLRLARFFIDYKNYLKDSENYYKRLILTESIDFKLINEGTIPACDVDVKLHFPDGFLLKTEDNLEDLPEEPQPPLKPGEHATLNASFFSTLQVNTKIGRIPLIGKGFASITKTKSYEVEYDLDTLKHNQDFVFEKLFITFDEYKSANGFTIDYQIFAANIPDILTGKLNVIVDKE